MSNPELANSINSEKLFRCLQSSIIPITRNEEIVAARDMDFAKLPQVDWLDMILNFFKGTIHLNKSQLNSKPNGGDSFY